MIVLLVNLFVPTVLAFKTRPTLVIIVTFPPDDLKISIRYDNGEERQLNKNQKAWESYYYYYDYYEYTLSSLPEVASIGESVIVQSSKGSFECPLFDEQYPIQYKDNIVTLNLNEQRIVGGQSAMRQPLLISMRVVLTLIVAGLIFLAFGYRKKVSWIVLVAVHLITQGVLQAMFRGADVFLREFLLRVSELIIFIVLPVAFVVPPVAFVILLKEHNKGRAAICAFAINIASLVLSAIWFSFLPV